MSAFDVAGILREPEPIRTGKIKELVSKVRQLKVEPIGDETVVVCYDKAPWTVDPGGTQLPVEVALHALSRMVGGKLKPLVRCVGIVENQRPAETEVVDDLQPETERELDASKLFEAGMKLGLVQETTVDGKEGFYYCERGREPVFLAGTKGPAVVTLKRKPDILRALDIQVGD